MADRLTALVDRAWPWAAVAFAAVAVLVVVVAFATQPARRDDDRVRYTLADFVTAANDRDADTACGLLTPRGREAVTAAVPGVACEVYARSFGFDVAGLGGVMLLLPPDLPDKVLLNAGNIIGADGQGVGRTVELVRVGDDFRIDALGR
ncbi:MAG: hypothetical protein JWP18_758 [Solirubrobacterales bacterium]|jgi:hypothetical protein|nr:hypothetical protein [Solirubrobacterales bacterium]